MDLPKPFRRLVPNALVGLGLGLKSEPAPNVPGSADGAIVQSPTPVVQCGALTGPIVPAAIRNTQERHGATLFKGSSGLSGLTEAAAVPPYRTIVLLVLGIVLTWLVRLPREVAGRKWQPSLRRHGIVILRHESVPAMF